MHIRADKWTERWTKSTWKQDEGTAGDWIHTAGKWYGNADNKGIQTTPDSRFFAISSEMKEKFDNKDKDLVLQFTVKHEQGLKCGGGYIKLLPESSKDQMEAFGGDTPYSIMFGPDVCGSTKKVHVIFTYKGNNLLTKKTIKPKDDKLTHVYTLVVKPSNDYQVLIDNEVVEEGSLYDDWDFLPPKMIDDPEAEKPEDWDERPTIPDPEDKKPEGWDDIPEYIADPDATKPDEWDDEEDGQWEPPKRRNPEYKGEWVQKTIDNPNYKGIWKAPQIPNPEYVHDDMLYHYPDTKFVGFELWQVEAGSIFDNILIADDAEYAKSFAKETWGDLKEAEEAMMKEATKDDSAATDDDDEDDEEDEDEEDYDFDGEEEEEVDEGSDHMRDEL
eukprot:scaffold1639_cov331-Pavlova_lutheri.AAC.17